MKKSGIKDRIIAVLKYKGLNVNKASKMFGIPQRTLNRQVNEDGKVAMELIYAVLDFFPEISPLWLIMGEGDMLREENSNNFVAAPFYSDLPVSAGYRDCTDPSLEKASGYISLPSHNASFYFPVSGTSMEPEVFSGDIVGVVRVEPNDRISPESIYMIVTNEARMMRLWWSIESRGVSIVSRSPLKVKTFMLHFSKKLAYISLSFTPACFMLR